MVNRDRILRGLIGMTARRMFFVCAACMLMASLLASLHAEEPFYQGTTLTFVVGYSAGSSFDTYTRILARHIGRHIPGHPKIVVENVVGGGGIATASLLYKKAKPDGLTVGHWMGDLVLQQIFGSKEITFDARRFEWVGVVASNHPVCIVTAASGIKNPEDWAKAKRPVRLGGMGPNGAASDVPRILSAALDLPIKVLDGYKGSVKVRLAAENHEVDGGCWHWPSIKKTWSKMLSSGMATPILQAMDRAHPELPSVPNALELAKNDEGRQLIKYGIHDPARIARSYALPPGTPQARVTILRQAFMQTVTDPSFVEEAKSMGLEVSPISGADLEKTVTGLFEMDPKLKVRLRGVRLPAGDRVKPVAP